MTDEKLMSDRKEHKGQYTLHNHLYHWLLDNYEPQQLKDDDTRQRAETQLRQVGFNYTANGGDPISDEELDEEIRSAVDDFIENRKQHGDTADRLGKGIDLNNATSHLFQATKDRRW